MVSSEAADEQKKKVPYALLLIGKEKGKENDLNGQVSSFGFGGSDCKTHFTNISYVDRAVESCL